jgi:AbiV family abortive infection protein
MKSTKGGSFLQINNKECEVIYVYVLENGQSLLKTGQTCAEIGNYGLAITLSILGIEESIKGVLLFVKSQGVNVHMIRELKQAITGDHQTRHETVALLELVKLMRSAVNVISNPKDAIRNFLKNPVAIENLLTGNLEFSTFNNIDWWTEANEKKNNGFYACYKNGLRLPSDTTQDEYLKSKAVIDDAMDSIMAIVTLFKSGKNTAGLATTINAAFDLHNRQRGFQTHAKFQNETLPWPEYIPSAATKLLLGTFPTEKSNRAFDFFYPNRNNRFWSILSTLTGLKITFGDTAVVERKQILDVLKLGITDSANKILRQMESSLDGHLFPTEFTDVFDILSKHPSLTKIILTSSSGENNALAWFTAYCSLNEVRFTMLPKKGLPKYGTIPFEGRKIEIVAINSPSRRASIKDDALTEMYRHVFGNEN